MRTFLRWMLYTLVLLLLVGGGLFAYFIYSPAPGEPRLTGKIIEGSIEAGDRKRTYSLYAPMGLAPGAALVVVMHGSGSNGGQMRVATGYGFERLADERGFAVVYPEGVEGYWNACNVVGDYTANKENIDDVAFLIAVVDKLAADIAIDATRVFATGISRGGHMAYRLALEAPTRFRAVAAVAANVPAPENFKCKPAGSGTSSVMIMNGTLDPLNPFNGGEAQIYGFIRRGKVLSSNGSAEYFAGRNNIAGPPAVTDADVAGGVHVQRKLWKNTEGVEVELVAIVGGGHVLPQPYWRYPRMAGPTPTEPNGPAVIWDFFARQTE